MTICQNPSNTSRPAELLGARPAQSRCAALRRGRLLESRDQGADGHTTDSEVARYTAAADQRTLSDTAADKLLANLAERLAKDSVKALKSGDDK
ncbi:hypothetical protein [Sphingomonas sp. PP-CE-3A-406]|uniref:hypothetical protein n=1 Tax=Sphingomonas sp. PP-CE-3A-406 TaxID=2135659 RepID=UPI001C7D4EA6|nr:hypothetical protein [Sphingomonas sp. PP-CE-3A-406]